MLDPDTTALRLRPLERSTDVEKVNAILNHPSVFPSVTLPGFKSLDIAPVLANECNIALLADGGVFIFICHEPGIYEVHTNFIRTKDHKNRGIAIRDYSRDAARWMFTKTDCITLLTRVPAPNKAARLMLNALGWTFEFYREAVWPTDKGLVGMSFHSLHYADWFRGADELADSGHWFHDLLESEFVRHGVVHAAHPDEEIHDRAVGAAVETIVGGQPEKAMILYNRWANFAGYVPIRLIARDPLLFDIGDAVLQVAGNTFKAIVCRSQPQ